MFLAVIGADLCRRFQLGLAWRKGLFRGLFLCCILRLKMSCVGPGKGLLVADFGLK